MGWWLMRMMMVVWTRCGARTMVGTLTVVVRRLMVTVVVCLLDNGGRIVTVVARRLMVAVVSGRSMVAVVVHFTERE